MRNTKWLLAAIVGGIVLLLLFIAGMFSGWSMMRSEMVGRWGYSPFGWIVMIFMWLIPISLIALAVLGIVWLIWSAGGFNSSVTDHVCPNCRKRVQTDFQNCPYCETSLK